MRSVTSARSSVGGIWLIVIWFVPAFWLVLYLLFGVNGACGRAPWRTNCAMGSSLFAPSLERVSEIRRRWQHIDVQEVFVPGDNGRGLV